MIQMELNKEEYLTIRPFLMRDRLTTTQRNKLLTFLKVWCESENRDFKLLVKGLNGWINPITLNFQRLNITNLLTFFDTKFKVSLVVSKDKIIKVF